MSPTEQVPPISTARLVLRQVSLEDRASFVEMYSDPEVMRYLYDEAIDPERIPEYMTKYINGTFPGDGDWLSLAVTCEREVIGVVSICYRSAEHRQAEIGYTFKRRAHGHGYATEAAERMVTWCFDELKVHRVVGRIEARNIASERVLQRLGMRKEAHLIQNEWVKGEWNDEVVYAITEPEWRARQSAADVDGS